MIAADVSPDGRLLATGDGDGVRLWEADTGRELAQLKAGRCETVLFHPDGQSLISSGESGLVSLADPARSRARAGRNPRRPTRAAEGNRGAESGKRPGFPTIGLWR